MKRARGFTIIEIAVVIAIVSILVTLTVVTYIKVQADSRDRGLQNDVQTLKGALARYYNDKNEYPLPNSTCYISVNGCNPSDLSGVLTPEYIDKIPASVTKAGMKYGRYDADSTSYAILVVKDNGSQCKTGIRMVMTWYGSAADCNYDF